MPDDIPGNRVCSAPNRTILVVDDISENLLLLDSLLTAQGYTVRLAPSGAMALRAIAQQPPDLILLDILMPNMDGYEVCRRLKASEQTRSIPVIFSQRPCRRAAIRPEGLSWVGQTTLPNLCRWKKL